jgi:hypothetical protein
MPLGSRCACNQVGDLLGQAFRDLEPAGEVLDHVGQFGQAEDAVAGEAADVIRPGVPSRLSVLVSMPRAARKRAAARAASARSVPSVS